MTTLSFVAGLTPLLIASGPGAEERRSIAVLAVGGQTLSLILTLLAVPVIYSYLDDLGQLLGIKHVVSSSSAKEDNAHLPEVPQAT
jgi:HAE1 family hydrophobic/amphiphilic exporter-1